MPAERGVRALRAAVFAAVCVLLGAIGHELMSGMALPWWALAGGACGTALAAWSCAGRERSAPWVVAFTVAVQAALHTCFTLAQSATAAAAGPRPPSFTVQWARSLICGPDAHSLTLREATRVTVSAGLGAHPSAPPPGMGSMADPGAMAGMGGMGGMRGGQHGHAAMGLLPHGMSGTGMLAAHLLAALACGLWLAHGERAAFRLLRVLAQWFRAPLVLPVPHRAATPRRPLPALPRDHGVRRPRRLLLTHCVITRGPPAASAVV
ncbi:hypothetical protein [Streptomyces sp. NRRL F-5126]|uniref:hypothetical protein n=1 Tax=Streptomyces sp. NRRL F-5126 TaxID=1463857 RepID=UPI0004C7B492|nr:hypothetical protein [Streptomyces sp. NRRL F-5126]